MNQQKEKGYIIGVSASNEPFITCLKCGRTSYNPNDIKYKFCGYCDEFHEADYKL